MKQLANHKWTGVDKIMEWTKLSNEQLKEKFLETPGFNLTVVFKEVKGLKNNLESHFTTNSSPMEKA